MGKIQAQFLPAEDVTDVEFMDTGSTAADKATDEWSDFLSASETGAIVYIYRQNGDGRSPLDYVDSFPVDEFEPAALLKKLRDGYGGGTYRIQIRHRGRVLSNKLVSIAGSLKPSEIKQGDPVMLAMLERMDRLTEHIAGKAQAQTDPMTQMRSMLEMMTMMRGAMGLDKAQGSPVKDLIEMMGMMRELKEVVHGDDDKEPSVMGMLGQALPALIGAATRPTQTPIIRQTLKPNPARPNNPQAIPMAAPKPEPELPAMLKELTPQQIETVKGYLNQACMAASFGADPEKIAVKILENVEDEAMLKIIAETPDLVDQASKIAPDVLKHREWFNDLQEWVKGHLGLPSKFADQFEPDDADESETDEPNGETLTNE